MPPGRFTETSVSRIQRAFGTIEWTVARSDARRTGAANHDRRFCRRPHVFLLSAGPRVRYSARSLVLRELACLTVAPRLACNVGTYLHGYLLGSHRNVDRA